MGRNRAPRCFNVFLDNNGNVVVQYVYDAWGNHVVYNSAGAQNSDATFIGNVNPFRYRGYYYDVETGLYYLQTRYYDPVVCRFVSRDSIEYADPESINGLNLYAYCGNNPVMNVDPNGTLVISFIVGLVVSFAIGFASSSISQGIQYGWENINWVQSVVDGLFAVGSAALAATGIGLLGSVAIGALMGGAQYALSCAFHWEALTWEGALIAVSFGAVAGAISGAGASNGKVLANGMTGRAQTGMKAVITTVNKYGINSSAYKNVMNLYGKAIAVSVQTTINKEFTKSVMKIWASTVVVPFAQWGANSLVQLIK